MIFFFILFGVPLIGLLFMAFFALRAVQAVGIMVFLLLCMAIIGTVYCGLIVAGITVAVLYQVLGPDNMGWAIAIAGIVGLMTGWMLLKRIGIEVTDFSKKLAKFFNEERRSTV